MKPTQKQKEICHLIEFNAKYWKRTNDINSPTHGGDLVETIKVLEDLDVSLTEEQKKELENKMNGLLNFIRKL